MTKTDDLSDAAVARLVLRRGRTAALATLARRTGHPFASMVSIACEPDGAPILLLSTLAAHSRNLAEDPRASLLIEDRDGDPQRSPRVTLTGRIERIAEPAAASRRYLARQPEAELYAGFGDFAWFRLVVEEAHLVAGFGRAARVRAGDLLLDVAGCDDLLAGEPDLLAAFAEAPARVGAIAAGLAGGPGDWRVVGVDPEGLDIMTTASENRRFLRLVLPQVVASVESFRNALAAWEIRNNTQEIPLID